MRSDPDAMTLLNDCEKCMARTPKETRQALGCGYEPRIERVEIWQPPGGPLGYSGPDPTTCPGYTTTLPEVIEVARARFHWEKNALQHFTRGAPPSEHLMLGIEVLSSAAAEAQHWRVTPAEKGGGG